MKEKLTNIALQLFATKFGWLLISMLLIVIFGSLSTHSAFLKEGYLWCDYALIAPAGYLLILFVIMIFYMCINTYKDLKDKFKNKNT